MDDPSPPPNPTLDEPLARSGAAREDLDRAVDQILAMAAPLVRDAYRQARDTRESVARHRAECYEDARGRIAEGDDPIVIRSEYACRLSDARPAAADVDAFEGAILGAVDDAAEGRPLGPMPDVLTAPPPTGNPLLDDLGALIMRVGNAESPREHPDWPHLASWMGGDPDA